MTPPPPHDDDDMPMAPPPELFEDTYVFVPSDLTVDPDASVEANANFLMGLNPIYRLLADAADEAMRATLEEQGINRDPLPITSSEGLDHAFRACEHARVARAAHEMVERFYARQWMVGMGCAIRHDPVGVELMMTELAKKILLQAVAERQHQPSPPPASPPPGYDDEPEPPKRFDDRHRYPDPRDALGG